MMQFAKKNLDNHRYNNIVSVISAGRHFDLNGALQPEQSAASTALHRVSWIVPRGSVFVQQALSSRRQGMEYLSLTMCAAILHVLGQLEASPTVLISG